MGKAGTTQVSMRCGNSKDGYTLLVQQRTEPPNLWKSQKRNTDRKMSIFVLFCFKEKIKKIYAFFYRTRTILITKSDKAISGKLLIQILHEYNNVNTLR